MSKFRKCVKVSSIFSFQGLLSNKTSYCSLYFTTKPISKLSQSMVTGYLRSLLLAIANICSSRSFFVFTYINAPKTKYLRRTFSSNGNRVCYQLLLFSLFFFILSELYCRFPKYKRVAIELLKRRFYYAAMAIYTAVLLYRLLFNLIITGRYTP